MEARLNSTVDARFNQLFTLSSSITSRDDQNDNSVTAASDAISAMTVVPSADYVHAAQWLCWHGRMNRLPKDYKFPTSINGKIIWDLFYFGEVNQKLSPFRFLESKDFGNDTNQVSYFTKARCVVSVIGVLAFKANEFLIPGSSIEGSPVILRIVH
jgi:hypothetical protein